MTIYTSPFEPVANHYVGGVFDFLLGDYNQNHSDEDIAIIDGETGAKTTYRQLASTSLSFASGYTRAAGLSRGDTVLIFSPNSVLYPALLLGGQAAGLVVSTANSSYTPAELSHQIELAIASNGIMLVGAELITVAKEAAKLAQLDFDKLYVLPGAGGRAPSDLQGLRSFEQLLGDPSFKPVRFTKEQCKKDLAFLPFSSGTTGKGKGVKLSISNITSCVQQTLMTRDLFDRRDSMLTVLPMYHIFGLIVCTILTLHNGGTMVIVPKFDLASVLALIEKHKITAACVVPPIALGFAKHPLVDKYDLSSLRYMLSGAAPLSADLQLAVQKRLKNRTKVVQGYGMSETTSVGLIPSLSVPVPPGSVGQLLSGIEARLVKEDGTDAKKGEAGELWLRGNNIMLGYMRNEKATKETINDEGYLMTGDICERDDQGFFKVVERLKELIKYKGFQVAPAEVEGCLLSAPFIADCAVIGVWVEEQATELPRAYIVPSPDHAKSETLVADTIKWVEKHLAPHKRLRGGVTVLDAIPKSPSGKILRKDLRVLAAKEPTAKANL